MTFESLGVKQLQSIVGIELRRVQARLRDRALLTRNRGCSEVVSAAGLDPVYGARPLKRTIQRELETPLSKLLLSQRFTAGTVFRIDGQPGDDTLTITVTN